MQSFCTIKLCCFSYLRCMKRKPHFFNSKVLIGIAVLISFTACKKNNSVIEQEPEKQESFGSVRDSAFYVIDGKASSVNLTNGYSTSFLQPNAKVDSIVNYNMFISGDKDSVMYVRTFYIHDSDYDNQIKVSFAKKYRNYADNGTLLTFVPQNELDVFGVGKHPYAVDLEKENTQNGIVIEILSNRKHLKTNGPDLFGVPTLINKDAQKGSTFEVTKLTKLEADVYLLEAKFSATLFDDEEKPKKMENGYLRLRILVRS